MIWNGVDLVEIHRFEDLNPRILSRFINRVYTPAEQEICATRMSSFAGRFAAKEAVAKVLGTGIGEVRWQDIEILRKANGEPFIQLHNKAKECAEKLGIKEWSLSISHGKNLAIAFVIAS